MNIDKNTSAKILNGLINNDNFSEDEAREFLSQLDGSKPSASEKIKRKFARRFTVSPTRKHEGYIEYVYGGAPYLDLVEGHEMDTRWKLPLKEKRLVSLPPESEWVSQADYVAAHPTLFKTQ